MLKADTAPMRWVQADDDFNPMSAGAIPTATARFRKPLVRWLMQKRWRMTRALTLGAQVCVIDTHGRVLLVRHGYRPGWHFPGGGVELGETIVDAAVRELEEEAGVVAIAPLSLHGVFNNADIFYGDHILVYVARDFIQQRLPQPGLEIAEHGFFAPDALPAATSGGTRRRLGEIVDHQPLTATW